MDICQSCGIPRRQDPHSGGTEADGSRSALYCSYCYKNGAFTEPQIDTAAKMQRFCIEQMVQSGMWRPMAWLFTRRIPKLQRWRQTA